MEMKKHGRRRVEEWRGWNNVYFTENNAAQKICMRDEDMDGGSRGPVFRRIRNAETKSRAGLHRRDMMTLNQPLEEGKDLAVKKRRTSVGGREKNAREPACKAKGRGLQRASL